MRRLLCVAALAVTDAAAKFALEKNGRRGRLEAVVRQPRRGGRAAHREAAEPVL